MNWHQDQAEWSASETMLHDLVKGTQGKMTIVRNEAGFQSAAIKSVNPVGLLPKVFCPTRCHLTVRGPGFVCGMLCLCRLCAGTGYALPWRLGVHSRSQDQGRNLHLLREIRFQTAAVTVVHILQVWAYPATKMQSLPSLKKRTKGYSNVRLRAVMCASATTGRARPLVLTLNSCGDSYCCNALAQSKTDDQNAMSWFIMILGSC